MMKKLLIGILFMLLAACAAATSNPQQSQPAKMAVKAEAQQVAAGQALAVGIVASNQATVPVAGTRVLAYPLEVLDFSAEAPYQSAPVAADGAFTMQMPTGEYYFIAVSERTYTYYGRNPVVVTENGAADVKITLTDKKPIIPQVKPQVKTGAYGVVTHQGRPLAGAVIAVYTDLNNSLKGLGLGLSAPTGEDGVFQMELPPGRYYLVARKRNDGGFMGPLQAGDYFGYLPNNPVQIGEEQVKPASIAVIEVPDKVTRLADKMFGDTWVKGKVVDSDGQPIEGLRVLLYDNAQMLNRPLFVSQPTAADGSYVISFPTGGTYWLAARNKLGGPPGAGELYGRFLGNQDGSVRVDTGEGIDDVILTVEKMK